MTGAISISMTYGIDISPENDPNFEIALLARQTIRGCLIIGSALVDMFPALKYLPTWFPGAEFRTGLSKPEQPTNVRPDGSFISVLH